MCDVAKSLERQGIASFIASWDDLITPVTVQLKTQGAEVTGNGAIKPVSGEGATEDTPAAGVPIASHAQPT
jgi:hypothetical protein